MSTTPNVLRMGPLAAAACLLVLLAGCGGGGNAGASALAVAPSTSHAADEESSRDALNRCALLKDDEIEAAIGAHRAGRAVTRLKSATPDRARTRVTSAQPRA